MVCQYDTHSSLLLSKKVKILSLGKSLITLQVTSFSLFGALERNISSKINALCTALLVTGKCVM